MSVVTMPTRKPGPAPVFLFPGPMRQPDLPALRPAGASILRRGTAEQGRALEVLGHAIEYLVDSRLFVLDQAAVRSDDEAVQIMMRMSRAVFAECPEVVSLRRRLRMWIVDRLAGPAPLDQAR